MIVYGTRATLLKTEPAAERCLSCNSHTLYFSVFSRYAHVFWIPFFPIGKTAVSVCSNCKQTLKLKDMPQSYKLEYDNIKGRFRIPVWQFAGLALLIIGIAFGVYTDRKTTERINKYVASPQVNDVVELRLKAEEFTTIKIRKVAGDTLIVVFNKYQTNQSSGLGDLKKKGDDDYDTELSAIPKSKLQKMNADGDVIGIDRN